jgi:signal transduction histidine kinase
MSGGTTLAQGDIVHEPVRAEAVWRAQRDRFFLSEAPKTSKFSMVGGLVVQATIIVILAIAGYPFWRVVAMIGIYAAFCLSHALVLRRARVLEKVEMAFIAMNVSAQLFVVGSAALTGGVHSPFLPNTVLPAIVSLLFFGPMPTSRWIALGNGLLVLAMVSLPGDVVGPSLPGWAYTSTVLLAIAWNVTMLHTLVGKLNMVSTRTGERMACLREDRLAESEARLHRLQSVGAKVAHELKNPLASIKGLCQLVARTPESERTQERLVVVASEIERMETILREYLSFSRPLEDLKPEAIDLRALSQDVLDVLAGRADGAGITMEVEGRDLKAQGDPRRLKEALINLVANALEATPTGGSVTLKLRREPEAALIEVVDSGRGISAEDLGKLGTSFFTTRPGGTGLGVVLAQGVITQHGGTLDYASTVGRGTTVTIRLPIGVVQPALAVEASPRAALAEARA